MRRVLLNDDNVDILESVSMLLDEEFSVVSSLDSREALALAVERPFDVVLADLMMPHLDGASFVRALRAHGVRTPVVLMSAAVEAQEVARAVGAVAFLAKPFSMDGLFAAIAQALGLPRALATGDRSAPVG
jgi:CheY-like chemotaxis protein